jgi:hypothetical protein
LREFCHADIAESDSPDWEWMGGFWYCDAIGFTWFGRLREVPDETGGLEIDLVALPEREATSILVTLQLPLHAGMRYDAIAPILGEPFKMLTFVRDRKTYKFRVGLHQRYHVSCTVRDDGGLIFISVIREDIFDKIEAA